MDCNAHISIHGYAAGHVATKDDKALIIQHLLLTRTVINKHNTRSLVLVFVSFFLLPCVPCTDTEDSIANMYVIIIVSPMCGCRITWSTGGNFALETSSCSREREPS